MSSLQFSKRPSRHVPTLIDYSIFAPNIREQRPPFFLTISQPRCLTKNSAVSKVSILSFTACHFIQDFYSIHLLPPKSHDQSSHESLDQTNLYSFTVLTGNDDLSLPRATVQKIISEILTSRPPPSDPQTSPSQQPPTFARDARDLLIECSVEFITLISSEANEIMERESKKTISIEHVERALRELGFPEYVGEVVHSAGDAREVLKQREKRQGAGKWESSGLSEEELMRQQQALFASAGAGGA